MTIFCNHCGKLIWDKTERFRAILPTGSYDWRYYHDACFVKATPPEHRTRGSYRKSDDGVSIAGWKPVVECLKCGCLYRSDGITPCPQRGLKQHKVA